MTAPRVVGLDLSLTATGMAAVWVDDHCLTFETTSVTSKGRRGDSLTQRYDRLQDIVDKVGFFAKGADLVVVEGPSVMSKGGSNWDRAGLWWTVVSELGAQRLGLPVPSRAHHADALAKVAWPADLKAVT